jgi:hypothetical protein
LSNLKQSQKQQSSYSNQVKGIANTNTISTNSNSINAANSSTQNNANTSTVATTLTSSTNLDNNTDMIHHLTNHRNGANIGYYNETGKRRFF